MSAFSTISDEISRIEAALRAEVPAEYHHIADELKVLAVKLTGQAEQDTADLAAQAKPMIATAEADATSLAKEAVAGAAEALGGAGKPTA